jgi:hypothetical protein
MMQSRYEYSAKELELRSECEHGFNIGLMGRAATSPTGEPYVELINTRMLPAISEQAAYDQALDTFRSYAEGKSGVLYWRVCPEIAQAPSGWKFYMRMLISDKPVLVASESDDRTANNAVRHTYRVLTDDEKSQMVVLKDMGAAFISRCNSIGKSRELSLAVTKAEEAVMWAVKHVTS